MKKLTTAIIGIILVLVGSHISHADTYIHTPLRPGCTPQGINNLGEIVGVDTGYSPNAGFKLSNGAYSSYGIGSYPTTITGINDAGTMVGYYRGEGNLRRAFSMISSGAATYLDYPDALETYAQGINNRGAIVGWWRGTDQRRHGFIWRDGNYYLIDYPNARDTWAFGINDDGTIVGWFAGADGVEHGFTRSNTGAYSSFSYPGADYTHAYGINNKGTIVGAFPGYGYTMKGFTLDKGIYAPLDVTHAFGINEYGWIVSGLPLEGNCLVLTPYSADIIQAANIDNVSDTFTLWMDLSQVAGLGSNTPAPDLCGGTLKILNAAGRVAIAKTCEFQDQGTGRHKITMQITEDNQPQKRARYVEKASFYGCNDRGSSNGDLSDCSLINVAGQDGVLAAPIDFSVYGTTFDIGKHAWSFRSGAWNNTPGRPFKIIGGPLVYHNTFYDAASVIHNYLRPSEQGRFWEMTGYTEYNAGNLFGLQDARHGERGLSYGLTHAAIANYTYQDEFFAWSIAPFLKEIWDTDIVNRWIGGRDTGPFGPLAPGADIFTAPSLNDSRTIWTIDSAKKIMYYHVSQFNYKGSQWVGQDRNEYDLTGESESDLIDILKNGSPVSLGVKIGNAAHAVSLRS